LRTKHLAPCAAAILLCTLLVTFPAEGQSPKTQTQARPDGIQWIYNLDEGLAKAKDEHKTLMVEFMASWCSSCKEMEKKTFSNSKVKAKVSSFVPVRVDIDQQRAVAEKYNALAQKYGGIGIPNILFLSSNGTKIKHIVGSQPPKEFLATLNSVLTLAHD
jgi:thioredoxin:protein disulfide reductase